eukprot:TRINITY_DN55992_c0_g1_i1.p1 TRINITY_DN55992_c0_g1~~TRINITY_DN55992_c0_g1_i1.p1  ORF type:complete len:369 (-),score=40.29 TRINITY_DN55992_c0_g1_i1:224-1183(-)
MVVSVAAMMYFGADWAPPMWQFVPCFLMIKHWFAPSGWCPAPPSWTIEALVPAWLLYPYMQKASDKLESRFGANGLIVALLSMWVLTFGTTVIIFCLQGFQLYWTEHSMLFFWPPAQVPDFCIGVLAAAIARRHQTTGQTNDFDEDDDDSTDQVSLISNEAEQCSLAWMCTPALLADVSFFIVAAAVVALPPQNENCQADGSIDLLLSHCFAPLIALFLYASCKGGVVARILSSPPLVLLGNWSFEVYLFQWPLDFITRSICRLDVTDQLDWSAFAIFFFVLWVVAACYAELCAPPLVKRIRLAADTWGRASEVNCCQK